MTAADVSDQCPVWCLGSHRPDREHHSVRSRVGGLVAELVRYPGSPQVYLSLLEPDVGGQYLMMPMTVVPLIATAALRLAVPAGSGRPA
jgi:hypothetical protein